MTALRQHRPVTLHTLGLWLQLQLQLQLGAPRITKRMSQTDLVGDGEESDEEGMTFFDQEDEL